MQEPTARLGLAFVLGALLAGVLVTAAGAGGPAPVADDLGNNTVWVGGTLAGADGGTVRIDGSPYADDPVPVGVAEAALFTCEPTAEGVACSPVDGVEALPAGVAVCASVRAESDGLAGVKLFANATCSLAPA